MKIYLAIGRCDKSRVSLFKKEGVQRVLVSYASFQGEASLSLPFSDVMLDSGAYSVATDREKVSVRAYGLWLSLYLTTHPQIKEYVNLDDLSDPIITRKNQEFLESLGLHPIPVYHYGEPTEILDALCSRYRYVGLGGIAVGTMSSPNLQKFWEFVYERYSSNIFHIFGVGTMAPFFTYQPYSLDCTSWSTAARFGDIMCYKDGLPCIGAFGIREGITTFFTTQEMFSNNIRALLSFEKCEWVGKVRTEKVQKRLL